ncbi:MAG: glutaredoxin family protein, partial [Planctomycetaceae bacterium]
MVYSRDGCHLCDDAKELLADYAEYLPEVVEVDIDSDPRLRERYGTVIPVVEIDGRERFRGRIDERLLRRLIDATPEIGDET